MITKINGSKYSFEIFTGAKRRDCCFFIKANSKTTDRFSCINNLNAVLSEFNVDDNNPKFFDSMWVVTKDEANHFEDVAKRFLSDPSFLDYLERNLDEDRMLGEWENKS